MQKYLKEIARLEELLKSPVPVKHMKRPVEYKKFLENEIRVQKMLLKRVQGE